MVNWKNSAHLKMNEAGYALVDTLNKCSTIWKQISNHLTQQKPHQHSYCEEHTTMSIWGNNLYFRHSGRITGLLKGIASKCSFCKCRNTKKLEPLMSDLPSVRTEAMESTSTNTNVDLFQRQPSKDVLIKMRSWNMQKIYRRTPTPK